MEEVLRKYKGYSRQVEMAWMEVTNGSLQTVHYKFVTLK